MLVMYSKEGCSFCVKAKKYLQHLQIDFREINVDHDLNALAFLKKQQHKTVPQFYQEDYLASKHHLFVDGGCDGLLAIPQQELMNKISHLK